MRNSLDLWRARSPWSFFDELENALNTTNRTGERSGEFWNFTPAVDIDEKGDHFLVSADLPGVNKDDVKIEVNDGVLTISGERHQEKKATKEGRTEKYYGRFERSFTLPAGIEADKIEARFENGVLELAIPKAEEAKPKTVAIQSGKEGFLGRFLGPKGVVKDVSTGKAS